MKKIILSLGAIICLSLSLILTSCETRLTCKKDCSDQADKMFAACSIIQICYFVIDIYESACKAKCEDDYKI
jgi:hypothetical protein